MLTLKDIARECKVSFSTVSKALKGSPEISIETTEFIQRKAREMGYHPNIAARSLRTNRTYDIGVLFEDKTGSGFQHQYFAKIISGFQNEASKKHYEITFITYSGKGENDYYNHAQGRNFDGVAIFSADYTNPGIKKLVFSEIPTVTLDYCYDQSHLSVMSDNKEGMKILTNYVIQNGHKKIGIIHGENTLVTQERKEVFIETCKENGIEIPEEYFVEGLYHDPITSSEGTNYLLSLENPPTCIFYPDDYSALGGMREINARKLKLGKDISIVGYDGIMLTSMMIPPLTTYEQNGEEIGRQMAEKIISVIENQEVKDNQSLVSGRIIKGGTVSKLN